MANILRQGSTGSDVQSWQGILAVAPRPTTWVNANGITRSWPATWAWPMAVDGSFGKQTSWATEAWQAANGLFVDGVVGPTSWAKALPAVIVGSYLKGVDLSAVQGVRSDAEWASLANAGVKFAFMRAVVGNESWTDASAKQNIARARAHGIKAGAYCFAYVIPKVDPEAQAEDFVRKTEAIAGDLDLPLVMDLEWPPREQREKDGSLSYPWKKWGCSAPQMRDWIMRAFTRGEALTGHPWIAYSFRYWLQCIEATKIPELASRPLWLADYSLQGKYPTAAQAFGVKTAAPWDKITMIQFDGDGGLKLPSGTDADFNLFLGSEDDLNALAQDRFAVSALPDATATVAEVDGAPTDADITGYRNSVKTA